MASTWRTRCLLSRVEYAIFNRSDYGYWQGLAGAGEEGETPTKREAFEEVGFTRDYPYIELASISSLPVEGGVGNFLWRQDVYVLKEFLFGVKVPYKRYIIIQRACFEEAVTLLK
ncbi:hypothetical protein BFM98_10410 [Lysinibacillus sp. AR18-8]|uniref:hypothetical protein n=1 Tax=Lysinibacillus sp. AR18-8 TaxID=1889781 RepID=UPI000826FC0B|nr:MULTISPECIES: hypothetical protein [Lysinibacillus]OCX63880.1 hypothetical protein BFM98_10410 [Lysinibacillus sp. AR18-8]RDV32060.1 NUDIX pyrophosphatase [Lysinibacillus capsici]